MTYPTRNPAINPYTYCSEAAIQNLCAYLGAAMPTTDQMGYPLNVTFGAQYPSLTQGAFDSYKVAVPGEAGPTVVVSMESWGRQDFGAGMGALNYSPAQSQVWTLTASGAGLSGQFTLSYGTDSTASWALNVASATAAQVQAALQAMTSVGAGNMLVTGGPFTPSGGSMTVTAAGALANQALPALTFSCPNLAGVGAALSTSITIGGGAAAAQTVHNLVADDCIFLFEVYGLLAAQRQYLVDSVLAAVPFDYYTTPAGWTIEHAIVQGMAARGVMLRGWRGVRFLKANFSEPRPEGQWYQAEMRLRADINMVVATPNTAFTQAQVSVSSTVAGNATAGQSDAPVTVTATS